jgi:hypothetical protein
LTAGASQATEITGKKIRSCISGDVPERFSRPVP